MNIAVQENLHKDQDERCGCRSLIRVTVIKVVILGLLAGGFTMHVLGRFSINVLEPGEFQQAVNGFKSIYSVPLFERIPRFTNVPEDYPDIAGENVFNYVKDLTAFAQQSKQDGNVLWGRIQGSKYEREATEYVAEKFKQWGLQDVRLESFPLSAGAWLPSAVSLETLDSKGNRLERLISAMTAYPSGETPKEGLVAPIEYVGLGSVAELRGKDLEGKIALLYVRVFDGVLMHSGLAAAARIAATTDAAGIILWMDAPGNASYATQIFSPTGGWIDNMPWTNVGFEDGLYLRQLIEDNPDQLPEVRLTVNGKLEEEGTSQNLVGILPGATDENLIITAHIDGFFNAILDNSSGVASLMELARYYSQIPQSERRRNLVFMVAGDHELEGAGGSAVFETMNPELVENSVLALQLEHTVGPNMGNFLNTAKQANGSSPLMLFISNGSDSVRTIFKDAINRYDLTVNNDVNLFAAGDVEGLSKVASTGLIQTGYLYHSDYDSLDWYTPESFENVTRAHAYVIDRLNKLSAQDIGGVPEEPLPTVYYSPEFPVLMSPW